MTYQCIPLSEKDYKATLKRVLEHPSKAQKYAQFNERYELVTQAIKKVESLGPNEYLPMLLEPMKMTRKPVRKGWPSCWIRDIERCSEKINGCKKYRSVDDDRDK